MFWRLLARAPSAGARSREDFRHNLKELSRPESSCSLSVKYSVTWPARRGSLRLHLIDGPRAAAQDLRAGGLSRGRATCADPRWLARLSPALWSSSGANKHQTSTHIESPSLAAERCDLQPPTRYHPRQVERLCAGRHKLQASQLSEPARSSIVHLISSDPSARLTQASFVASLQFNSCRAGKQ